MTELRYIVKATGEEVAIPAIPHLRTSERKDFKRCPQRWHWAWRKGYKRASWKPDALWFGSGIHLALQHRYAPGGKKRGHKVLKTWRDYVNGEMAFVALQREELVAPELEWVDAQKLGEDMLGAYLDEYGMDERWDVISAEQTFELPVRSIKTGKLIVHYNGTFDLVARDEELNGSLWVWDHKTAKAIFTGHLPIDDQAGAYWAVAGDVLAAQGLIKPGEALDGILYNFLRKSKHDDRPRNAAGQYLNKPAKADYIAALQTTGEMMEVPSKMTVPQLADAAKLYGITVEGAVSLNQGSPNFLREAVFRSARERKTQLDRISAEAEVMQAMRSKRLPLFKNPTRDCSWDCSFREMCELHEQSPAQADDFAKTVFKRVDPYSDHRKSADAE